MSNRSGGGRRHFMERVSRLVGGAGACVLTRPVRAQSVFPQAGRPIRLLVPLAAGGSLDFQARAVAQRITEQTGIQVLVENRPGASMMLGALEVARAQPDGHTLLYTSSSVFAQNPHTLAQVSYDPFRDFTPVTMAARGPLVLTAWSGLPVSTVGDLVAWGRANPGRLVFGSFGMGTASHVYAEAFAKAAGMEIVHVPYKGTADVLRDLFEGRVMAYFDAAPTAISNERTGRIRILGVASPARNRFMPQVPTLGESGIAGLDLTSWVAVVGPARLPADVLGVLNRLFRDALASPAVSEAIARGAYETDPGSPEDLARDIRQAYDRWGDMIRQIGFQKQ